MSRDNSVKIGVKKGNGRANLHGVKIVTPLSMKGTKMVPNSTVTKSFMHNRRIP